MNYNYFVSVRLMTFNHGNFIVDALDGINKQQTNFIFEVVIGDDFSSDNNLEKINKYRFTNKNIRLNILNRKVGGEYWIKRQKLGRLYNFTNIIENCEGKYIALLDGDDYWTDPLKLQKQVDFLESNMDYVLVGQSYRNKFYDKKKDKVIYSSIIKKKPMTLTLLFRNIIQKFPFEIFEAANGDTFLRAMLSDYGDFYSLDSLSPCVREVHLDGAVSTLDEINLWPRRIKTHEALLKYYKGEKKEKFYREKVARFRIKYNSMLLNKASFKRKIELIKESIKEAFKGYSVLYFIKVMIFNKE